MKRTTFNILNTISFFLLFLTLLFTIMIFKILSFNKTHLINQIGQNWLMSPIYDVYTMNKTENVKILTRKELIDKENKLIKYCDPLISDYFPGTKEGCYINTIFHNSINEGKCTSNELNINRFTKVKFLKQIA